MLPAGTKAVIRKSAWPRPELFGWLQREGGVAEDEMHRVFNCGIGLVLVVAPQDAQRAADSLRAAGETVHTLGAVEAGAGEPVALVV